MGKNGPGLDHFLRLGAQLLDTQGDQIALLQELRRLHSQAYARGGARDDDITRKKGHELAQMGDDFGHRENHIGRIAFLPRFTIDLELHFKRLRIWNLVGGDQPRAYWAKRVKAFSFCPLPASLDLPMTLGDIVGETISGNIIKGLIDRHFARRSAHDKTQFYFPVTFLGSIWQDNVVIGTRQRRNGLGKHHWLFGNVHSGFFSMLAIIQPDSKKLTYSADGRTLPDRTA